jgi:predicted anti-sigma-YlaC factor YlaD
MSCPTYREAVSARLDGEPLGMPAAQLEAHLAACGRCAAWAEDAARVTRRVRLTAAPAVPDLTAAVLARLPQQQPPAPARPRGLDVALRLLLLAVALLQSVLAWPSLAAGSDAVGATVHMTRETGAWNLAVAATFVTVAAVPRLAAGALPFLGTVAALLTAVTLTDLSAGHLHAEGETAHLLLLAGVALIATLAWRARSRDHSAVGSRRVAA